MTARMRKTLYLFIVTVMILCGLQVQPQRPFACLSFSISARPGAQQRTGGESLTAVPLHGTDQAAVKETRGADALSYGFVSPRSRIDSVDLMLACLLLMLAAACVLKTALFGRGIGYGSVTCTSRFTISYIHCQGGSLSAVTAA